MKNLNKHISNAMKSILLVDNNPSFLTTFADGLANAGYLVETAESVEEAEALLLTDVIPDLVILEVCMPEGNGLALTKRLEELGNIPFIVITNCTEQKVIDQANALGAMGYLFKPICFTKLIPQIEIAISRASELNSLRKSEQILQNLIKNERTVSLAVGILMDQHRLSTKAALEMLRKTARDQNLKLIALATSIVDSRETLNIGKGD
ncbi:MAG: response regulator [Candidatus Methylopumilus sp.]|jgi:response regulator NasT